MIKKAMIMAAGAGTRLNPLTLHLPKPMMPVANEPILEYILRHLQGFGINDIIANTHHLADAIHNVYGGENHLGVNFQYVHEPQLSGTAGGVKKTEFFFDDNETLLVISGDALTDIDIEKMYQTHKSSNALATMALREVPMEDVDQFGVVVLDENSKILEFQEKPPVSEAKSNLVNTGIYMFEKEVFNRIPADTFYDFGKQVFPEMLKNNDRLFGHVMNEYWNDIGTIKQYRLCAIDVLNKQLKTHIGSSIGENTIIEDGAVLTGDNIIGKNCVIKSGAQVSNSMIWDNTVIEGDARLNEVIAANLGGELHVIQAGN